MSSIRSPRASMIVVLAIAAVARIAAAWHWSAHLDDDRDVYRALALGIVEGRGFSSPGTTNPTAYRPPLYPLLLAAVGGAHSTFAVAALNVILGSATVALVLAIGRQLLLDQRAALLAALLTAIDPLLLYYTSFPMTETLCTCLLTAWLWTLLKLQRTVARSQMRWAIAAGVLLGLSALCRPTVWACAVLLLVACLPNLIRRRPAPAASRTPDRSSEAIRASAIAIVLIAAALTISPWGVRNGRVLASPIITTTHGGYTLLLGNNPAYYREVVGQPPGVVWDGSHGPGQQAWAADLLRQTQQAGVFGEVERDRWMSNEAWQTIRAQPGMFARACLRRFLHFWSVVPSVRSDASLPGYAVWAVGSYYGLLLAAFTYGCASVIAGRVNRVRWLAPLLLVAGFAGVHLVYWSDARMRAPVMPAIASLAACGLEQIRKAATRGASRESALTR